MAEERIIVPEKEIKYSGLFNADEVFSFVRYWLTNKMHFTPHDLVHEEHVDGQKKTVIYEGHPYINATNYVKFRPYVFIHMSDVTDVTIEKNGEKIEMNKGNVTIKLEGRMVLDWVHLWEKTPFLYFLRAILDMYIFKMNTKWFERTLTEHMEHFHAATVSMLNLYRNMK